MTTLADEQKYTKMDSKQLLVLIKSKDKHHVTDFYKKDVIIK